VPDDRYRDVRVVAAMIFSTAFRFLRSTTQNERASQADRERLKTSVATAGRANLIAPDVGDVQRARPRPPMGRRLPAQWPRATEGTPDACPPDRRPERACGARSLGLEARADDARTREVARERRRRPNRDAPPREEEPGGGRDGGPHACVCPVAVRRLHLRQPSRAAMPAALGSSFVQHCACLKISMRSRGEAACFPQCRQSRVSRGHAVASSRWRCRTL
jgi:hypothetical protein